MIENEKVEAVVNEEDDSLIIKFRKPYKFEGREYTEIDLTPLENVSAADMIATNKVLDRSSAGASIMPEVTLEYACVLCARAVGLPIEFFMGLPPKEALAVKNRVMGFLFGSD